MSELDAKGLRVAAVVLLTLALCVLLWWFHP